MASQERSMPFIKNLASSDRKIRTSAISSLHAFLSARQVASALTPIDVLKLWKGLFYALWMCDRAIPQQNLCNELADLIHILPRETVATWLRGFWATMAREWTGIDVLRMEKFLLLVRRVVGAGFKWMRKGGGSAEGKKKGKGDSRSNWDANKVDVIVGLLGEWPLALEEEARIERATDSEGKDSDISQKIPAGLRLHVLDIWVDEAEKAGLLEDDDTEAKQITQRISDQIDALEEATTSPAVRVRSKESLADNRLFANREPGSEPGADECTTKGQGDGGDWDGFDD
ncbi:nucleolar protein,Nop52-domain-containing protein [Corynascus novoguineensis]|uniref:Nucleolar protein,Nop52-domain-containing protein n=1 Tax=Corynascus novoguineensis TaxID=1126955 RepID=A0AAN7CQ53_9PEZI|nr:nucleolar protein,Nop52-domain-containing protein [Corynascus novoguineensis]